MLASDQQWLREALAVIDRPLQEEEKFANAHHQLGEQFADMNLKFSKMVGEYQEGQTNAATLRVQEERMKEQEKKPADYEKLVADQKKQLEDREKLLADREKLVDDTLKLKDEMESQHSKDHCHPHFCDEKGDHHQGPGRQ